MRLQLTIQRHGLPSARIIWATDLIDTSAATAGSEATISQLLEQINDIIPLESTDWGLEDYTIEVGGFECLHFSQASRVLKEDDNVTIRPLNTSDLRFRKVSGRHQISADGRHLIDGVAFGRPFLRRAERPAIRIPPRKRRRLTYDEVSGDEEVEPQQQLIVRNEYDDDDDSDADSDYNESEALEAADEDDLDVELVDILADPDAAQEPSPPSTAFKSRYPDPPPRRSLRKVNGLGLRTSSLLVDENGIPFPGDYDNPLLDYFADDGRPQVQGLTASVRKEHKQATATSQHYQKNRSEISGGTRPAEPENKPRKEGKTVRFEDVELATPATIQLGAINDPDDSDDADFEPFEDENEEVSESDKENATPGARIRSCDHDRAADSEQSSSSESESESDETSSSGTSDSGTSSSEGEDEDFVGEFIESKANPPKSSSSDTSSPSGSSSGSERLEAPLETKASKQAATPCLPPAKGPSLDHSKITQQPVSPGAGKRGTRARNQRRKEQKKRKKLLSLQKAGELPSNATLADMPVMHTGRAKELHTDGKIQDEATVDQNEATQFEAKRNALLQAISSGGIDVQDNMDDSAPVKVFPNQSTRAPRDQIAMQRANAGKAVVEKSTSSASDRTLVDASFASQSDPLDGMTTKPVDQSGFVKGQTGVENLALNEENRPEDSVSTPLAPKPRMRLDMDSSRRLLFGALGHRAPKSKDEETLLQAKLTRDAKSSKMPLSYLATDEDLNNKAAPPEDLDSWKDKIELSAVECCYEGIELSTPPFPFVQRWDPQQQTGYFASHQGRPQNRKKRKRNDKHYEASIEPHEEGEAAGRQQLSSYGIKQRFEDDDNATPADCNLEPAQQMSDENGQAASEQLLRETEETVKDTAAVNDAAEELPKLPDNPSTYPDLKQNVCSAGAIIAFKQLDMSAETKWAPVISEYRTALIDSVLDDGTLSLRMALRDIPQQEKQYDEETGERIYSKFEMPGYGETDSNEDNGMLELAFVDLIEPKLVRAVEDARQPSKVDEVLVDATPDNHEATEDNDSMVMRGDRHQVSAGDLVQDSLNGVDHLPDDAEVREEFRKEFKDLMKEAGWHSSVQSNDNFLKDPVETPQTAHDHQSTQDSLDVSSYDGPTSPRFDGFNSSSPAEEYQEAVNQIIYPALQTPSSPTAVQDETTMDLDQDQNMADLSSQADREAMRALREDFEKEVLQPVVHPLTDSDRANSEQDSSRPSSRPQSSGIAPQPKKSISPPPARGIGSVEYSSLISTIPDSQPQLQASTFTTESYEPPQSSSSSDDFEPPPTDRSFSSDDELPSLQSVMTSFSSQRPASIPVKPETYSDTENNNDTSLFLHNLPSHSQTNGKPPNSKPIPRSKSKKSKSFDVEPTKVAKNDNEAYRPPSSSAPPRLLALHHHQTKPHTKPSPRPAELPPQEKTVKEEKSARFKRSNSKRFDPAPPSSSQDYIGTQVVDLTLGSDPVTLEEEEEESSMGASTNTNGSLPKGAGWVAKTKTERRKGMF